MNNPCAPKEISPRHWSGKCEMIVPPGGYNFRSLDIIVSNPNKEKRYLSFFKCTITSEKPDEPVFCLQSVTFHPETLATGLKILTTVAEKPVSSPSGKYFLEFELKYKAI